MHNIRTIIKHNVTIKIYDNNKKKKKKNKKLHNLQNETEPYKTSNRIYKDKKVEQKEYAKI
jgi:hypothetical protein